MSNDTILSIQNVYKSFSGVTVLKDVNLDVKKGEVHVLVGENGAGKSTLMKIISGVYEKDSGKVVLDGEEMKIRNAKEAQEKGISIIHQEFNLLPHRSVAQNIYLGREPIKGKIIPLVDTKETRRKSKELLDYLGLDINPNAQIHTLGIAQQQMVEVAKAISFRSKVLIMDEPTATLTSREIDKLFEMIRQLRREGVSIIYISHRLEEFAQIADRVTVLRDGQTISTMTMSEASIDEIIKLMVGREISNQYHRDYNEPGEEVLRVNQLSSYRFKDVSINVRRGEIVGISGLVGAGRTELAKAVFGDEDIENGSVTYFGEELKRVNTRMTTKRKIGFLPEDRKVEGVVQEMSIRENVVQASLKRLFPKGIINFKTEKEAAEKYRNDLKIMTTSLAKPVKLLSGGNQQKVVIAKWLCADCEILIFDEPTRGIDVGAKAEIYSIMNDFVRAGKAILMISSDMPELLGVCDRIYTMKDGRITGEFTKDEATQENLLAASI